jgi:ABC-type glycerol-3-phosphate transport system permease component
VLWATADPARGRGLQHDFLRPAELGPLAAAALIVTLPVLLMVFAQRQIVAGLTAGAVKGG